MNEDRRKDVFPAELAKCVWEVYMHITASGSPITRRDRHDTKCICLSEINGNSSAATGELEYSILDISLPSADLVHTI